MVVELEPNAGFSEIDLLIADAKRLRQALDSPKPDGTYRLRSDGETSVTKISIYTRASAVCDQLIEYGHQALVDELFPLTNATVTEDLTVPQSPFSPQDVGIEHPIEQSNS